MTTLSADTRAPRRPDDPAPASSYPGFRRAGPFVFLSGICALPPEGDGPGAAAPADIRDQTAASIENLRAMLEQAGAGLENLVEVTVYLANMNDFGGYNDVYSRYFPPDGPARTTVAVHQLPSPDLLIEIRGTAYITQTTDPDHTDSQRRVQNVQR